MVVSRLAHADEDVDCVKNVDVPPNEDGDGVDVPGREVTMHSYTIIV